VKSPPASKRISGTELLCETLDKLVQPALRDKLIAEALQIAGAEGVPDDVQQLAALVGGPLFGVVAARLGDQAALCVIEDLAPIIRKATPKAGVKPISDVRRRKDRPASNDGTKWVVLADDDASLREVMATALRRAGHQVIAAPDGHIALAACRRHTPDLVISDVDMPTMSGVHLAWLLALSYGAESPPVILWTGSETGRDHPGNVLCVMSKAQPRQLLEAAELVLVKGDGWNEPSR